MIFIKHQNYYQHVINKNNISGATVPLSVILVGVGDFEFKKLELLD